MPKRNSICSFYGSRMRRNRDTDTHTRHIIHGFYHLQVVSFACNTNIKSSVCVRLLYASMRQAIGGEWDRMCAIERRTHNNDLCALNVLLKTIVPIRWMCAVYAI